MHELSLVVRTVGRSLPKFESPNVFPLTDSPNIMSAKFSAMQYSVLLGLEQGTANLV